MKSTWQYNMIEYLQIFTYLCKIFKNLFQKIFIYKQNYNVVFGYGKQVPKATLNCPGKIEPSFFLVFFPMLC